MMVPLIADLVPHDAFDKISPGLRDFLGDMPLWGLVLLFMTIILFALNQTMVSV